MWCFFCFWYGLAVSNTVADIVWQSMDAAITSQAILVEDPSGDLPFGHQGSFSTIVNGTEASSAATTMAEEVVWCSRRGICQKNVISALNETTETNHW
jgi:hypothetical protein